MSSSAGGGGSPGGGATSSSGGTRVAAVISRRRRACSLRHSSVSLRDATVISQPRGLAGTPWSGHWTAARQQRLLRRVLAGVEVPVPAHQRAGYLRRERPQQILDAPARLVPSRIVIS